MNIQFYRNPIGSYLTPSKEATLSFKHYGGSLYALTPVEAMRFELAKKLAAEALLRFNEKKQRARKKETSMPKMKKFFSEEAAIESGSLKKEQQPVPAPFPQDTSQEAVESPKGVLPPTKEQVIKQLSGVAKKWVFKVVPKILPAVKPVFKAIKTAKKIFSLGQCIHEKDIMGTVKKILSIAIKVIGSLVGGIFFEIFDTVKKAAKWAKLIAETLDAVKNAIWYLREGAKTHSKEVPVGQVAALEQCSLCRA